MSEPTAPGGIRNTDLLGVYTNDHLASATGGVELVSRMLGRWRGTSYEPRLEQLLDELREERTALRTQMQALGLPVREYKQAAVWLGEKLSRAKLNGHLVSRSPLSDLVEFEFIATAVLAKRAGFETLRGLAAVDDRLDAALAKAKEVYPFPVPHLAEPKAVLVFKTTGAAEVELSGDDLAEIEAAASKIDVQGGRYSEAAERMTNL